MHQLFINPIWITKKLPKKTEIFCIGQPPAESTCEKAIQFIDRRYELASEIPDNHKVVGYLHAERKEKQNVKWNGKERVLAYNSMVSANIFDKPQMQTVGYLKTNCEGEWLEVTRPSFVLYLWLFPILLALITVVALLFYPTNSILQKPVFGNDSATEGGITTDRIEPLDPVYFNVKINATPIVEDGQMNLRIENSSRNAYSCHVKVVTDADGKELLLYNSPLIAPNQSMEYTTLEQHLPPGIYDANAVFTYFEGEKQLSVNTTIQLILNVR